MVVVVQAKGAGCKILHYNISRKGEGGWQNMTVDDNSHIQQQPLTSQKQAPTYTPTSPPTTCITRYMGNKQNNLNS